MATKVTSFQVENDWLYILLDDGKLARKYLKGNTEWEKVDLPTKALVTPKQSKYERI